MRLFIAGPGAWRVIRERLPEMGHTAYDWTIDPGWDNPDHNPSDSAAKDLLEIERADAVIWYLDGKTCSHGAPFEVGYAVGIGKPVGVWLDSSEPMPSHWIYAHWLGYAHTLTGAIERAKVRDFLLQAFGVPPERAGVLENSSGVSDFCDGTGRRNSTDTEPDSRPIGSIQLWSCDQQRTYIWDAEQTKRLLQALEAKVCRLVDTLSERIDNLSERVDSNEEWIAERERHADEVCSLLEDHVTKMNSLGVEQ